jgi:hypothetical protein
MLYTPVTKRTIRFCYQAHAGQLDKAGLPYVNHPLHLAEQMTTEDETCVALLHDVMEDCGATPEDLLALGLSHDAVAAVQLLTRQDGVPYLDYVRTVGENPIARRVKVADLRHNSDLARLDEVGSKDVARLRKYRKARVILGDMATELQTPAGAVSMESAGEPYPFEARARADGAFTLEADVLPLSVGEKVELRYDFGHAVAQGASQHAAWRVYQTAGVTIGVALAAAGAPALTYHLDPDAATVTVTEDPVAHRFDAGANSFAVRVAWRRGTGEQDVRAITSAAGA